MKTFISIILFYSIVQQVSGQMVWNHQDLVKQGFVTNTVEDQLWASAIDSDAIISIDQYSTTQRLLQNRINENASAIVTYHDLIDTLEWTTIDKEDITPFTWRWIDLVSIHANGDTTSISLRRPVWWLKQMKIQDSGDSINLQLPEMDIQGMATVISIRPNQLDTRFFDWQFDSGYLLSPITGKFMHHSHNVYSLFFDGLDSVLSVTAHHRLWSVTRNTWVEASQLIIGEAVMTKGASTQVVLVNKVRKPGVHVVYNLEVYRSHNYHVSYDKIVTHNTCIGNRTVGDVVKSKILPYPGQITVDKKFVEKTAATMEEMIARKGSVDWEMITRNASDGKILGVRYADGTIVIINGRHRVVASELVGAKIPWDNPNVAKLEDLNYAYTESYGYREFTWNDVSWGTGKKFEIIKAKPPK